MADIGRNVVPTLEKKETRSYWDSMHYIGSETAKAESHALHHGYREQFLSIDEVKYLLREVLEENELMYMDHNYEMVFKDNVWLIKDGLHVKLDNLPKWRGKWIQTPGLWSEDEVRVLTYNEVMYEDEDVEHGLDANGYDEDGWYNGYSKDKDLWDDISKALDSDKINRVFVNTSFNLIDSDMYDEEFHGNNVEIMEYPYALHIYGEHSYSVKPDYAEDFIGAIQDEGHRLSRVSITARPEEYLLEVRMVPRDE